MFWLFFWAQITLAVAAVALLWLGLRGRPVDDHPHCRACGYDLFGLTPGGRICPECGADLKQRGVRFGARARRGGVVTLALLCGAAAYGVGPLRTLLWREWVARPAEFAAAVRAGDERAVEEMLSGHPGLIKLRPGGQSLLDLAMRRPGPGAVPTILLAQGADPNARDGRARTPLHSAASGRNVEVVRVLINSKADVNAANDEGRTPLHLAAARRNWDVSAALVKGGARLAVKDRAGKTPAQLARETGPTPAEGAGFVARLYQYALRDEETQGRPEDVKAALRGDPAALRGDAAAQGGPLLHVAAALGQTDLAELLLGAGADPKSRDAAGKTALHRAAWGYNPRTLELLLRAGADVNARDEQDRTPLHVAADSSARPATARTLLDAGADPSAKDKQGRTPLEYAATSLYDDRPEFIEALLARGAKPDVYAAAATGRVDALRELLERDKALVCGGPGPHRASPLHVAAWHGQRDAARLLLDHGADVDSGAGPEKGATTKPADPASSPGRTPLFDAIGRKHFDVAELLLDRGARVDVANAGGSTPLHVAAAAGERPVRLLLRHGAKPNVADPLGLTPLHVGAGYGDVATVRALVEAGADVTAKDALARTALDHALRGNPRHPEVAAYLRSLGAPSHAPSTAPSATSSTAPATRPTTVPSAR